MEDYAWIAYWIESVINETDGNLLLYSKILCLHTLLLFQRHNQIWVRDSMRGSTPKSVQRAMQEMLTFARVSLFLFQFRFTCKIRHRLFAGWEVLSPQ